MPDEAVAFLGFADRASHEEAVDSGIPTFGLLALRQHLSSIVYPVSLKGLFLIFAVRLDEHPSSPRKFEFVSASGSAIASIEMSLAHAQGEGVTHVDFALPDGTWIVLPSLIDADTFILPAPGEYRVLDEGSKKQIGAFGATLTTPEVLTPDRIAAILADPTAASIARLGTACTECHDGILAYAALERNLAEERTGARWYADLPDEFVCRCGAHRIDLRLVRSNLIGYLGRVRISSKMASFVRMYERSVLAGLCQAFAELLENDRKNPASEETFQKFIETNPIILHQWPAKRIFFKPRILSFRAADFAIITPHKELILIELERPSTQLLKADGGIHIKLQHAFDQVNEWLHIADEQRLAVLDCIGVDRSEVGSIRGVVIAGRGSQYSSDHLRRLKGTDHGRIHFYTYEDLVSSLAALVEQVDSL